MNLKSRSKPINYPFTSLPPSGKGNYKNKTQYGIHSTSQIIMAHNLTYIILGTSGTGQHPGGHNTHDHMKAVLKLNNKTQQNTSATRTESGGLHSKSHTATRKLNHHTHNLYYKMQMSVHAKVYNKHYKHKKSL
jgi:hypothetical protein